MSDQSAAQPAAQSTGAQSQGPSLVRALGPWAAMSIVVGTVIGSGIFLVPTTMINILGSVKTVFAVWIVAGVLSLFGALTYAELAAMLPEAGGEYAYLREAYGPFWGFLYGWTQLWVAKSGSIATLSAGFYTYLTVLLPALGQPVVVFPYHIGPDGSLLEIHYGQLVGIGLIAVLAAINYIGVRVGGGVQVFVTGLKVVLIGGVIAVGLFSGKGDLGHLTQTIPASNVGISAFLLAMVSALWAYDGWNNVTMVASEIKEPQKNLPKALVFGTITVIVTYLLANAAYFYVLSPERVGKSPRLAADMMSALYGPTAGRLVTVAVLISILAALNGSILTGARVPYAMAHGGYFFKSIAKVHPRFHTPGNSIILLCAWSSLVLLSGWFDNLYRYVIFGSWILYALAITSVFVLRKKRPDLARPYRVVGYPWVPASFVLVAALLLVNSLQTYPRESLMGLVLMVLGVPFYWHWKRRAPTPASSIKDRTTN